MPPAAMSASRQFVTKRARISESGQPVPIWISTCTGSTGSKIASQRRGGVSSSAEVRMALGGQRIDVVAGGNRSWSPRTEPR